MRSDPVASVYLALGSNVGDRSGNLDRALSQLGRELEVLTVSSLYETEPVGYANQPPFLNRACHVATSLSPQRLLLFTQGVETHLGRLPTFRNGPRVIDIDILMYGDLQVHSDDLVIPHKALPERLFVLVPLAEIAPELVHPTLHKTIHQMIKDCRDRHWVRLFNGGDDVSAVC